MLNLKRVISLVSSVAITFTGLSVYGATTAVYDIEVGTDVLQTVKASSKNNWEIIKDATINPNGFTNEMKITPKSDDGFGVNINAGQDLYPQIKRNDYLSWNFESESDISSSLEGDGWTNMFTSSWLRPIQTSVDDVEYSNPTVDKSDISEIREPAAPGSKNCIKATVGANDWHCGTIGARRRFSAQELQCGKSYRISFYAMDNSAQRSLYCELAPPSTELPNLTEQNGGNAPWCPSDAVSIGTVQRYWSKHTAVITPEPEDFENGYTVLWLGAVDSSKLKRSEAIYIDCIELYEESDRVLEDVELNFSMKVKSQDIVNIKGVLNENDELFNITTSGSGQHEDIESTFTISPDDKFLVGETAGSGNVEDSYKFRVEITGSGSEQVLVKSLSLKLLPDLEKLVDLSFFAGKRITVNTDIYADSDGAGKAVLMLRNASGIQEELKSTAITYEKGKNRILSVGILPEDVMSDTVLLVYITDESGNILSARRHNVAKFNKNGVNICNEELFVGEAVSLFGAGQYLLEFDISTDVDTAVVTIGNASGEAVIKDGFGICIIEIEEDIENISEIDFGEMSDFVGNVTLKKVAD